MVLSALLAPISPLRLNQNSMAPKGIDAETIHGAKGPAAIADAENRLMLNGWSRGWPLHWGEEIRISGNDPLAAFLLEDGQRVTGALYGRRAITRYGDSKL